MKIKTYEELFGNRQEPVLITTWQNIFYTIGFKTTARRPTQIGYNCVLMTPCETCFLFPAGWSGPVQQQIPSEGVRLVPYGGRAEQLAEKIWELLETGHSEARDSEAGHPEARRSAADGISGEEFYKNPKPIFNLGFEEDGMELNLYLAIERKLKAEGWSPEWDDVSPHFKKLRLIKSPEEIEALRKAAALAQETMEYAKTILRPGLSEREIVAELEYFMRKNGSDGVPFTMKALAGENGLRTINLPGDYRVQEGDIVLLDFGTTVEGYASDWTRSFVIGSVTEAKQELYRLVFQIERSCIEIIRPGIRYQELMDRAMKVIYGHPLARWFNPYLGHSIGINSQEWPSIVPGAEDMLEENMVITIEPGIYVPGLGGVRIEDEVLVTKDGHEILTGLRTEEFLLAD